MPPNKKINCLEENSLKMGIGSNHISNFLETYRISMSIQPYLKKHPEFWCNKGPMECPDMSIDDKGAMFLSNIQPSYFYTHFIKSKLFINYI